MYKTRCHQELFSFLNHLLLHTNKTNKQKKSLLDAYIDLQKFTVSLPYHHSGKNPYFLQIPPQKFTPRTQTSEGFSPAPPGKQTHHELLTSVCCARASTNTTWCLLERGMHPKYTSKKWRKETDLKRCVEIHRIYRRWEIWRVTSLWKQREEISPRNI